MNILVYEEYTCVRIDYSSVKKCCFFPSTKISITILIPKSKNSYLHRRFFSHKFKLTH